MANTKISALTSATTPLAGTETLPIVQGGATVKATVANVTGSGLYAGSFTTLASSGNATLGDATTDTVRVNGYMGVGVAPASSTGLLTGHTALTGAGPIGIFANLTGPSTATTSIRSIVTRADTAAATFTVADVMQISLSNSIKGAGSTITNQHGAYIADQTSGTNNYGITSLVSSGTNKWNIYASGTAANAFAGNVRIGSVVAPTVALDVTGAVKVSTTITPLDNIIQGTAAKGVNFTANTPTAGMTSQLLNWYEEGTWTPTASSTVGAITTYSSAGTYTRVGRQVTVTAYVDLTNVGTASGSLLINNFPFKNGGASGAGYLQQMGNARETGVTGVTYACLLVGNSTDGYITGLAGGGITWVNVYQYALSITYYTV